MPENATYLYKVLTEPEYVNMNKSLPSTSWSGTAFDLHDKFIHLCTKPQITPVLLRYYSHLEFVFVLLIEEAKIKESLKWEDPNADAEGVAGKGEVELYPHLYGKLDLTNLRSVKLYAREFGGVFLSSEL
jgi:uncharacterized protein (DUF952 family)